MSEVQLNAMVTPSTTGITIKEKEAASAHRMRVQGVGGGVQAAHWADDRRAVAGPETDARTGRREPTSRKGHPYVFVVGD